MSDATYARAAQILKGELISHLIQAINGEN